MLKSQDDFVKVIGKRIYKDDNSCPCSTCKEILEDGIVVRDAEHAEYLAMYAGECFAEGIELNYRLKK